jgi:hypothetical protein
MNAVAAVVVTGIPTGLANSEVVSRQEDGGGGMYSLDRRSAGVHERRPHRSPSTRLADWGDRLARTFSGGRKSADQAPVKGEPFPDPIAKPGTWEAVLPRFPITRQGYDPAAVDGYVAQLEAELSDLDQELADLRSVAAPGSGTAAEIERIGEQASAILLAAHDSARDMTEASQMRADRCIAEAEANAAAITADGSRQLSELQSEMEALRHEQDQILEDVRRTGAALSALAAGRELH